MTRKEAIECHRRMWNWLAKTGSKQKSDCPEVEKFRGHLISRCFLCHYANTNCDYCPLKWPGSGICYGFKGKDGLYEDWQAEENIVERKAIALKIANLPEKK